MGEKGAGAGHLEETEGSGGVGWPLAVYATGAGFPLDDQHSPQAPPSYPCLQGPSVSSPTVLSLLSR